MKLFKKLIPIAATTGLVAVSMPAFTSCSMDDIGWIDGKDEVSTTGWVQATPQQLEQTDENNAKVARDYMKIVQKDPSLASKDFQWSMNQLYKYIQNIGEKVQLKAVKKVEIKELKGYLSDVSITNNYDSTPTYYASYKNGLKATVIFHIDGNITIPITKITEWFKGTLTLSANVRSTYTNVLGEVRFREFNKPEDIDLTQYTTFRTNLFDQDPEAGLSINDGWEFSYSGSAYANYVSESGKDLDFNVSLVGNNKFNKNIVEEEGIKKWDILTTVVGLVTGQWYSYYLNTISKPEPTGQF